MGIPARRRLYRLSIGIAAILAAAAGCLAQAPAWINKVQFFGGFEYVWPSGPVTTSTLPFTGQAWGFGPNPSQVSIQKREISTWHALGKLYIANSWLDVAIRPFPNSAVARCIDTYGNPRINYDPQYSISNPDFRQYLKSQVQLAIDEGADGIHFDGASILPRSILEDHDHAGCFDPATMAAFRAYLTNKFSTADLQSLFSISDASNFDYWQWIIQLGIQKTWNQNPLRGLAKEFFFFRFAEERAFLGELTDFAHQYASETYGRTATLSVNTSPLGLEYGDVVDFFHNEGNRTSFAYPFSTEQVKEFKGTRPWPVLVELETYSKSGAYPSSPRTCSARQSRTFTRPEEQSRPAESMRTTRDRWARTQ